MFAKVHVRCEEIRKQWYTGIEEESDETALLKRRAKLWLLNEVITKILSFLVQNKLAENPSQEGIIPHIFHIKYGKGYILEDGRKN